MKRTLRLLTAMVVTLFMVMSIGITAFAADSYTITINKPDNDTNDHTYDAYQVFAGTVSGDVLTEITWGTGVDGDDLLAALKANTFVNHEAFKDCTSAAQVAAVLEGKGDDSAFMRAFASVVSENLATKAVSAGTSPITVSSAGYYFIKDTDDSQDGKDYSAYTRFILKVATKNVVVNAKEVIPPFDKNIVEGTSKVKHNTVSVGDKVNYQIDSKVPDMDGYTKYFFVIEDTLSAGLTFNGDIEVYIGTSKLAATAYTIENANDRGFRLAIKNFIQYQSQKGNDIKVTYSATLNSNANITTGTNDNTAKLIYSNNPNVTPDSTTDFPGTGDVTGHSPDIKTVTGTSGIAIHKIDGETSAALAGAKFSISGNGVKAVITNGEIYKESTTGTYYMLKNGTFTDVAPTAQTEDQYDSTTTKYALVNVVDKDTELTSINKTAYSGADGYIKFAGLDEGTYTITEIAAPEGYNKISPDSFTVKLAATYNASTDDFTWTLTKGSTTYNTATDGCIEFDVENNSGATLPGTGGMGTTVFYVVGGLLIICAGALLITKIRMNQKNSK